MEIIFREEDFKKFLFEKFFEEKKDLFKESLEGITKDYITEAIIKYINTYFTNMKIEEKVYSYNRNGWETEHISFKDYIIEVFNTELRKKATEKVNDFFISNDKDLFVEQIKNSQTGI